MRDARLVIVTDDITRLDVDVVVNAANASLCGGGGVDGAIHRAAGPGLIAECRTLGGARTGEVKLTKGYDLRARFIAHAVGPVWHSVDDDDVHDEDRLLAACYDHALDLVVAHGLHTIAFPSISTGAYRFPIVRAARIALTTTIAALTTRPTITQVVFCCYSDSDRAVYERAYEHVCEQVR
ncbi:MAG TPA: macro domain-containing protein [Myxococcota bacterium]